MVLMMTAGVTFAPGIQNKNGQPAGKPMGTGHTNGGQITCALTTP